jgi:hypothetical protein
MQETQELPKRIFVTFCDDLNRSALLIGDPPYQPKPARFLLGILAKVNTLDVSVDGRFHTHRRHKAIISKLAGLV